VRAVTIQADDLGVTSWIQYKRPIVRGIRRRYATYSASPGRLRCRIQVEQRCRRGCKSENDSQQHRQMALAAEREAV